MPAKMRAILFTLGSFLLTAAVVGHAYYQRKQFYPSVVFITKSNPSMAVSSSLVLLLIHYVFVWRSSSTHKTLLCFQVIYTQGFVLVLLLGKLMRKLFFGQLRAAEFEVRDECNWVLMTEGTWSRAPHRRAKCCDAEFWSIVLLLIWSPSFVLRWFELFFSFSFAAFNRAIMVRRDGNVFSVHRL